MHESYWSADIRWASFDVLDECVKEALGDAPVPHIDINEPNPTYLSSVNEHPAYHEQNAALVDFYLRNKFIELNNEEVNEYGFSVYTPDHPVLADLNLMFIKYHWTWMEPIVRDLVREIKITEIKQGWKYSAEDRHTLIVEQARAIRLAQLRKNTEQYTHKRRIEQRWANHVDPVPTKTLAESAGGIIKNNLFLSTMIATLFYHKVKDAIKK